MRSKLVAGLAVTALASAALVGSPMDASAIQRDACNAANVEVYSDYSTCWAWPGRVNVGLYNTVGVKSGINAGDVYRSGYGYWYYYRNQISTWAPVTVTQVAIY